MLRCRLGLCSLLSSSFYTVITHLITDYTYITLCLFSLIHFIAHINFYHRSIHSIHLKISPDPLLRALPHLRALCLFPRPRAWDERAAMMLAWRAWMIGAGGNAVFVPLIRLSAHSLLGND